MEIKTIGLIGLGAMGVLYGTTFASQGYEVIGSDLPEKHSQLERSLEGTGIKILDDGIAVSRRSDLIIYSTEVANIDSAVRVYGPSTKLGAIVSGQCSVKTPEVEAFERYLPKDVSIIPCHSLHGPSLGLAGQSLAIINHRSSPEAYKRALETFGLLGSKIIEIPTYQEHDKITADTQAVTHLGFMSIGSAWRHAGFYPWENPAYVSGIDNVKVLMTLRIFGGKAHVYSGLAMFNPYAKEQIQQYAASESELFKLMIKEDENQFRERMKKAGEFVFGNGSTPISLDDEIMGEFKLGREMKRKPNSHLSLLAMVDSWHQLKINPYQNLICQTPVFRLRLGIAEYLFRNRELLQESLHAALFDKTIRGDDLEFHTAVREWTSIIEHDDAEGYQQQFELTKEFIKDRIPEGVKRSDELIRKLAENHQCGKI